MEYTNKLINEKSPYLLQHAHNPVNWYPWGDEAFDKAKNEDKPIFMSIGYSTCHWCHVMERESFEDSDVAKILNDYFISIKLDREERPDIDHIYMEVCQAMTGSGGWPLTILMDADKRPFFAGTYFPKDTLKSILLQTNKLWHSKREDLIDTAKQIGDFLKQQTIEPTKISEDLFSTAYNHIKQIFDETYGGFGTAPKFPTPHLLLFLLSYFKYEKESYALKMVETTLNFMYHGGIYDHIGHGFSRYSTDRKWLVPHFEKMLYDNALLSYTFAKAFSITGNKQYEKTAQETLDYMQRVMEAPSGGFYSAEDADSEGVEGLFYVWTLDQINQILGDDAKEFAKIYDITDKGNFEGKNIPNLIGKDVPSEKEEWAKSCTDKLFAEREKRIHPFKDDKILVSWNGLAISAFAMAARVMNRQDYADIAVKAADFIEKNLFDKNEKLLSRFRDNEAKFTANAEDYAFYIWGLLELHAATHNLWYLSRAVELTNILISEFWDNENYGFYFNSNSSEQLITRPKPVYDGAMPSANSVAAMNFLRLSMLTGDMKFEDYADKIFAAFSGEFVRNPTSYAFMIYALIYRKTDISKLTIASEKLSDAKEILDIAPQETEVVVFTSEEPIPSNLKEYASGYKMENNMPTAYLCKGHMCHPPVTDTSELEKLLI